MSLLRAAVPPSIRALRWRLPWVRGTDAFAEAPFRTYLRAARFTLSELAGGDITFRTPNGLAFATMPNNFSSFALFVDGSRDPAIWRFIQRRVPPSAVFVDVGANVGAYAIPAARLVGLGGRVIAFEAHPRTFRYLERSIAMNGMPQVTALNVALGAEPGQADMAFNEANPGETHVVAGAAQAGRSDRIRVTTLDAAMAELGVGRIDYLKIDVEGFELPVLQGARGAIGRSPAIMVQTELQERHASRYGHRIEEIASLLQQFGLRPHVLDGNGDLSEQQGRLTGDVIWLRH